MGFLAGAFFATALAAVCWAGVFARLGVLAVVFFAAVFRAPGVAVVAFCAGVFVRPAALAVVFFAAVFRAPGVAVVAFCAGVFLATAGFMDVRLAADRLPAAAFVAPPYLPGMLSVAGLQFQDGEIDSSLARHGEPRYEFERLTAEAAIPAMIATGIFTEEEIKAAQAIWSSPTTIITTVSLIAAWGRRGTVR